MHPFNDETLAVSAKLEDPASDGPTVNTPTAPDTTPGADTDPPTKGGEEKPNPHEPNPHGCDCDKQCHELHNDRLPKEIKVSR